MDKSKHRNVLYVNSKTDACQQVNEPTFQSMTELETEYFEMEMAKKRIQLDMPIQLGYWILQLAKLRMLQFYYDFMDVYCDRSDFEYIEMDTDSAYMAISGPTLKSIIKPEKLADYEKGLNAFCHVEEVEADDKLHWFPRECCSKHAKKDKRTPGLFKVEFQGEEMIGLCSKTYMVTGDQGTKFSSKGINKRAVSDPVETFRHVLSSKNSISAGNIGFRARKNTMFTYTQERVGFGYFYCKRVVQDDGIHTKPLDIVLTPSFSKKYVENVRESKK